MNFGPLPAYRYRLNVGTLIPQYSALSTIVKRFLMASI
jgi:hypothetical protein